VKHIAKIDEVVSEGELAFSCLAFLVGIRHLENAVMAALN